jgi:hypothetical protein
MVGTVECKTKNAACDEEAHAAVSSCYRRSTMPQPLPASASDLSFYGARLFSSHADLRISLRTLREGQRNPGAFQRMEGHEMS